MITAEQARDLNEAMLVNDKFVEKTLTYLGDRIKESARNNNTHITYTFDPEINSVTVNALTQKLISFGYMPKHVAHSRTNPERRIHISWAKV